MVDNISSYLQSASLPTDMAIILDLGGVITHVRWEKLLNIVALRRGTDRCVDYPALHAQFDRFIDGNAHQQFMKGKLSPNDFHQLFCATFGIAMNLDDFEAAWCSPLQVIPEVAADVLRIAKERDLIFLSNTDTLHWCHQRLCSPVFSIGSGAVLSFECGELKPQPEIFERSIRMLKRAPSQCIFIDDNPEYLSVGKSVGMCTIQITHNYSLPEEPVIAPTQP